MKINVSTFLIIVFFSEFKKKAADVLSLFSPKTLILKKKKRKENLPETSVA